MKNVNPEHSFKLAKGGEIKNLEELEKELTTMDHDTFTHHVNNNRNDFYNWINEVIQDKELAKRIQHVKSRLLLRSIIRERIENLYEEKEIKNKEKNEEKKEIEYKPEEKNIPDTQKHADYVKEYKSKNNALAGVLEFGIGLTIGATGALILAKYFL